MFEWIRDIGSIVGLLAGVFLIFDRLLRVRPVAYLADGGSVESSLIVKNPSNIGVSIRGISAFPRVVSIAAGSTMEDFVSSMLRDGLVVEIAPGDERKFPLILRDESASRMLILLWWRRSDRTWIPQFPKVLLFTGEDLISSDK